MVPLSIVLTALLTVRLNLEEEVDPTLTMTNIMSNQMAGVIGADGTGHQVQNGLLAVLTTRLSLDKEMEMTPPPMPLTSSGVTSITGTIRNGLDTMEAIGVIGTLKSAMKACTSLVWNNSTKMAVVVAMTPLATRSDSGARTCSEIENPKCTHLVVPVGVAGSSHSGMKLNLTVQTHLSVVSRQKSKVNKEVVMILLSTVSRLPLAHYHQT